MSGDPDPEPETAGYPGPDTGTPGVRREPAAPFRLRAERPRVMRLSRKVLAGGSAVAIIAITGAVVWALQGNHGHQTLPPELYNTDHRTTASVLANLPKDYTGLPRQVPPLGPPLPGDLGPLMLNAHTARSTSAATANPEAQRLAQEREAALTSRLFVHTDVQQESGTQAQVQAAPPGALPALQDEGVLTSANAALIPNGQDQKQAFVSGVADQRVVSLDRLVAPASPYVVQAGAIIPAALITGIRSDLPGRITAQVTQDVYDSPTGESLLIPQGARLIGQYDSQIAFGQSRVLLVWTRLIMPNGKSIVLDRLQGIDTAGYSGLHDGVDNHWIGLFRAAMLSTLLSVGAQAGTSNNANGLIQAIRSGASNSFNQTGQQIVQRNLVIQPTLTIRRGFPVDVMVNRDLVLVPYKG
jgi:type IV secretory pathway VirB10-like protein